MISCSEDTAVFKPSSEGRGKVSVLLRLNPNRRDCSGLGKGCGFLQSNIGM